MKNPLLLVIFIPIAIIVLVIDNVELHNLHKTSNNLPSNYGPIIVEIKHQDSVRAVKPINDVKIEIFAMKYKRKGWDSLYTVVFDGGRFTYVYKNLSTKEVGQCFTRFVQKYPDDSDLVF